MSKSASSDSKSSSSSDEGKKKAVEITAKIEGKDLVIRIPMQKAKESKSGKSMVIASTYGNVVTAAKIDGNHIVVGLNAYYYKPK